MRRLSTMVTILGVSIGLFGLLLAPAAGAEKPDKWNPAPLVAVCKANGGEVIVLTDDAFACLHPRPGVPFEDYRPKHMAPPLFEQWAESPLWTAAGATSFDRTITIPPGGGLSLLRCRAPT